MLVKKNAMLMEAINDLTIDDVKYRCCDHFLQLVRYIHDVETQKSYTNNYYKLLDFGNEIRLDPNLITFEVDLSPKDFEIIFMDEISKVNADREKKSLNEEVAEKSKEITGWQSIHGQLEALQDEGFKALQIKIFKLGSKDYFCYII